MRISEHQPFLQSLESSGIAKDPIAQIEEEELIVEQYLKETYTEEEILAMQFAQAKQEQEYKLLTLDLKHITTHGKKILHSRKSVKLFTFIWVTAVFVNFFTIQSTLASLLIIAFQSLYTLTLIVSQMRYKLNMPSRLFKKGKLTL